MADKTVTLHCYSIVGYTEYILVHREFQAKECPKTYKYVYIENGFESNRIVQKESIGRPVYEYVLGGMSVFLLEPNAEKAKEILGQWTNGRTNSLQREVDRYRAMAQAVYMYEGD